MIRTRDLVLFFSCLLFLLILIAVTVTSQNSSAKSPDNFTNEITPAVEIGAETTQDPEVDRASYITRLKNLLATDETSIEPAASVTTDADTAAVVASSTQATFVVQQCLYPDDTMPAIARWPLRDVELKNEAGKRVFYVSETPVITGSSSAQLETVETPLLTVPVTPAKVPTPSCVPSEVVGVTAQGVLMFNSDVRPYQNLNQNTLIGYARDGYPIYGMYNGEVDECGGYQHPAGYRYSVTPDRDYLIGCLNATPQTFTF